MCSLFDYIANKLSKDNSDNSVNIKVCVNDNEVIHLMKVFACTL